MKVNHLNNFWFALLVLLLMTGTAVLSAAPSTSFGPGQTALVGSGNGAVKIDRATQQVAVRFVASATGGLTEAGFAGAGTGFGNSAGKVFVVKVYDDAQGKPGRLLGSSTGTTYTADGPCGRLATFGRIPVTKGQRYHLVISLPSVTKDQTLSVNYYVTRRGFVPLDSFDMRTPADGLGMMVSEDAGKTWKSLAQFFSEPVPSTFLPVYMVRIDKTVQGWAYNSSEDLPRAFRSATAAQYVAQSFTFRTYSGAKSGRLKEITLGIRPSPGIAGKPVDIFYRIMEERSRKLVAERTTSTTFNDPLIFTPTVIGFSGVELVEGQRYVLVWGLAKPVSADENDFLFVRSLSWSIGGPSLALVAGWEGGANQVSTTTDPTVMGEPVRPGNVVLPMLITYTPVGR